MVVAPYCKLSGQMRLLPRTSELPREGSALQSEQLRSMAGCSSRSSLQSNYKRELQVSTGLSRYLPCQSPNWLFRAGFCPDLVLSFRILAFA